MTESSSSSPATNPSYYKVGEFDTIAYIESLVSTMTPFESIHVFNIIKYVSRFNRKNGVEDLEKAQWYLQRLIQNKKLQKSLT